MPGRPTSNSHPYSLKNTKKAKGVKNDVFAPGYPDIGVSGKARSKTQEVIIGGWLLGGPPQNKKPDLGLFMCVLRPHARYMMGAGTRSKIRGETNTQE